MISPKPKPFCTRFRSGPARSEPTAAVTTTSAMPPQIAMDCDGGRAGERGRLMLWALSRASGWRRITTKSISAGIALRKFCRLTGPIDVDALM